jgi:hypothetical protein
MEQRVFVFSVKHENTTTEIYEMPKSAYEVKYLSRSTICDRFSRFNEVGFPSRAFIIIIIVIINIIIIIIAH